MKLLHCDKCGAMFFREPTAYNMDCNIGYVQFTTEPGVEDYVERCRGTLVLVPRAMLRDLI